MNLVLFNGESLQTASVTLGVRADSLIPATPVPVPPGSLSLRVEDDSGGSWPFAPAAAAGQFSVSMTPLPGRLYRLVGTVMGRGVDVTTRTPVAFSVTPTADTITASDTVSCFGSPAAPYACVPVTGTVDGFASIACRLLDQQSIEGCFSTQSGLVLHLAHAPSVRDLNFIGFNQDFHDRLSDALVTFAAAIVQRRKVYLP